jgi:hypothetical protein
MHVGRLGLAALLLTACSPIPATRPTPLSPTPLNATRAPPQPVPPPAEAQPDPPQATKRSPQILPPPLAEPLVMLDAEVVAAFPLAASLAFFPLANDGLFVIHNGRYAVLRDDTRTPRWQALPRLAPRRQPEVLIALGGTWPDSVYATLVYQRLDEEEPRTRLFRWRRGAWRQLPAHRDGLLRGFFGLRDGSVLTADDTDPELGGEWWTLRPLARGTPAPQFPLGMRPITAASSPTGTLFVAVCFDGSDDYAVARFAPGGGPPIAIDALDAVPMWGISLIDFLLVVDDREAYVAGGHQINRPKFHGAYFARFDGVVWVPENVRTDREYAALARTADGVLWLTTACDDDSLCSSRDFHKPGRLLRRTGERQWQQVQLRVPPRSISRGPTQPPDQWALHGEPTFLDPKLRDLGVQTVASTGSTVWAIADPVIRDEHPDDTKVILRIPR